MQLRRSNPSLLLMLGMSQFALLLLAAESLYPGYSTSQNVISDLGVGPQPSRLIFTASVITLGVLALPAGLLYRSRPAYRWLAVALIVSGVGGIGLGIFNKDFHGVHFVFAFCGFFGGAMAAILARQITTWPMSIISVTLGLISLGVLVLFGSGVYLGFGVGGMERMMFYPFMLWAVAFAGSTLADW